MIAEIRSIDDPRFASLLALFHAEFPPETREPDEELRAEVIEGTYRYFVWADPDVRGFVRFRPLASVRGLFVIHIAVAPEARGQGIGGRLLAAVQATEPGWPFVCEVDPDEAMAWWKARGARTVTPTYTQPALRPDTGPVPFHLMTNASIDDPKGLVEGFYREIWGLGPDHAYVARAVEGIR